MMSSHCREGEREGGSEGGREREGKKAQEVRQEGRSYNLVTDRVCEVRRRHRKYLKS